MRNKTLLSLATMLAASILVLSVSLAAEPSRQLRSQERSTSCSSATASLHNITWHSSSRRGRSQ